MREWVIRRKSDGRYMDSDPYGQVQWVKEIDSAHPLFKREDAEKMAVREGPDFEVVERGSQRTGEQHD